ncbi:MAG: DUF1491 family protein [Novosphingobium sp.]
MDEARLPAHLEISALIRRVDSAGGFATVIARGERDSGTIMIVTCEKGRNFRAWERMPQADGSRKWTPIKADDPENPCAFTTFIDRRRQQDSDLWIVELDVAEPERFIG